MNDLEALKAALARERAARISAESILEQKSAELHETNTELRSAQARLLRRVEAADEELRLSLGRLRHALQAAASGAFQWEPGQDVVHLDDAVRRMMGIDARESPTRLGDWLRGIERADAAIVSDALERVASGRASTIDCEFRTAAGTKTLSLSGGFVEETGARGRVVFALLRDVTRRRAIEADERRLVTQKARQERLVVLGELASAISHEINQPLASICLYASAAQMLLRKLRDPPDDLVRALEQIVALANRASRTLKGLRGMMTRPAEVLEEVSALEIAESAVGLVSSVASDAGVRIVLRVEPRPVRCNRVLIEHALANLMRNAVESIESGGAAGGEREVCVEMVIEPPYVKFHVDDTGPGLGGLDPEEIFQPLFTSRASGSGMGLALCRTVAEQHSGWVRCVANPHHATGIRFEFAIPVES